jgi:hypothetical protein
MKQFFRCHARSLSTADFYSTENSEEPEDAVWFLDAFEDVLVQLHKFPGPAWDVVSDIGRMVLTRRAR